MNKNTKMDELRDYTKRLILEQIRELTIEEVQKVLQEGSHGRIPENILQKFFGKSSPSQPQKVKNKSGIRSNRRTKHVTDYVKKLPGRIGQPLNDRTFASVQRSLSDIASGKKPIHQIKPHSLELLYAYVTTILVRGQAAADAQGKANVSNWMSGK